MLYYILLYIIKPFYWLFRWPCVHGRENLKSIRKGKAIVISNHRAMLDPLLMVFTVPRFIHFMAKSELFRTWLGRWFFNMLLVFPVERKSADMKSMKKAVDLLDKGCVFGIFPEGKRSVTDDVDTFEKGTAFFALKAKAPILPMYIPVDNYNIFERPHIYVGKLITPDEYVIEGSKTAAVNNLTRLLEERVNELRIQAGD